jgi:hypothetical protein
VSRKESGSHRCLDCDTNVIRAGDYCMLNPELWEDRLGLEGGDNLCVACIEKRLGRELSLVDFSSFPWVEGFSMSALLRSRLPPPSKPRSRLKRKRGTR